MKVVSLCPDGVFYLQMAQTLEQGDLHGGFGPMRLNVYPLVLIGLNRLGLEWEVAGKWWSVGLSCLLVLPLFGWVRRQFDDRVAVVACLLYAVHAKFIVWSPETIRDPTFWFLFVLTLYLFWRAVTEVRLGLFLAAGLVVSLAVVTRFEGFFLLVPMGLWSFWRWRSLTEAQGRLVLGALVCVSVLPILALLVNLTWLHYDHPWEVLRTSLFARANLWFLTQVAPVATEGPTDFAAEMTIGRMLRIFVPTVVKGLTPVLGLLILGGLWGWRRVWMRRDHRPLFYVAVMVLVGVWIHLATARTSCPRYVLSVALMAVPFASLGLLGLTVRTRRLLERFLAPTRLRWAVAIPGLAVVLLELGDVMGNDYASRAAEVRLGHWLRQEIGGSPRLACEEGLGRVIAFYAQGSCHAFPAWSDDKTIVAVVQDAAPDAVVMWAWRWAQSTDGRTLLEQVEAQGFRQVDPDRMPPECREMLVVVREGKSSSVRPSATESAACRSLPSPPL